MNNTYQKGQSLVIKLVVALLNSFLLIVNFDKFTIRLHLLLMPSMLTNF